jgi:uncharacterized membrane protein
MADTHAVAARMAVATPRVHRIGEADLNWALAEGWRDFKALRGDFLILPMIYPAAGFCAAVLAMNASFLPLLFPMVAGLSILGPAVAAGFYELSRRRELGLDSGWVHFLDPLRGRGRSELVVLTAGLAVLFGLWLVAADLIFRATIGAGGDLSPGEFVRRLLTTAPGWIMIVVGNLVGFVFAVATISFSLVSFPTVVDHPGSAVAAVLTSIRAVRENPAETAGWGLRVAGLLAIGCAPLFLGLPIVLPVLGYATWRLYTRIVAR